MVGPAPTLYTALSSETSSVAPLRLRQQGTGRRIHRWRWQQAAAAQSVAAAVAAAAAQVTKTKPGLKQEAKGKRGLTKRGTGSGTLSKGVGPLQTCW